MTINKITAWKTDNEIELKIVILYTLSTYNYSCNFVISEGTSGSSKKPPQGSAPAVAPKTEKNLVIKVKRDSKIVMI